jgi:Rab3 GTPase-activating protein regulatory subunit N-terminus
VPLLCFQAQANGLSKAGWLADDSLVTSVHSDSSLCLGYQQKLAIVHMSPLPNHGMTRTEAALLPGAEQIRWAYSTAKQGQAISSITACQAAEQVMVIAWMHLPRTDRPSSPRIFQGSAPHTPDPEVPSKVILVGTSTGFLQLHNHKGHLLHRQRLHNKPVLGIQATDRVPPAAISASPLHDGLAAIVTFGNAVCCISAAAIVLVLHHVSLYISISKRKGINDPCPPVAYSFAKWALPRGTRDRADTMCVSTQRFLWQDLAGLQSADKGALDTPATFISAGAGPAVAMFEGRDAHDKAVALPAGKVDTSEASGHVGFLGELVNNMAGMVLGKPVDVAADFFGLALPGCNNHTAAILTAIVGAAYGLNNLACLVCCSCHAPAARIGIVNMMVGCAPS